MELSETPSARDRALAANAAAFGNAELVVRAPGRVNLIGEHTDYNEGFCLPMALPFDTVVVASASSDAEAVTIRSEGFGSQTVRVGEPGHEIAKWSRQIAGVLWHLHAAGIDAGGWNGCVATDIPTGASLSSSAAIEVAVALVVLERNELSWSPLDIAKVGQIVESEVVGIGTGIMDQYISAGAIDGHVGLLDCESLTLQAVPLPSGVSIAVMDTGTRRTLADAAYDERRANCEAAAAAIGVSSLRHATLADVDSLPATATLERARAKHVVSENERTLAAVEAMSSNEVELLGSLMNQSHTSLRDDFDVSSPALDLIVEVAQAAPGCLGARMTGGGFAGCAVALVRNDSLEEFSDAVVAGYSYADGSSSSPYSATIWFCEPQAGAGLA